MSIDQTIGSVNTKVNKTPDTLGGFVALKSKRGRALPELLAPAGSPKALRAAIAAGADAVYFALPEFNARINADNFTRESLPRALSFAISTESRLILRSTHRYTTARKKISLNLRFTRINRGSMQR